MNDETELEERRTLEVERALGGERVCCCRSCCQNRLEGKPTLDPKYCAARNPGKGYW